MILDLFPLPTVLFPHSSMPLHIFEPRYLEMIGRCIEEQKPFGVILLKSGRAEGGGPVEIHKVGTTAYVIGTVPRGGGTLDIQVAGRDRFEITEVIESHPRMIAEIRILDWAQPDNAGMLPLLQTLTGQFRVYLELLLSLTGQWVRTMELPDEPLALTQFVSAGLQVPDVTRQELLELSSPAGLMRRQLQLLEAEIPKLQNALQHRRTDRSN